MSMKEPTDKEQRRERRNRLLDSAAAAKLSLTEGVREMRAIACMTQEEFARHRGVSAKAIKTLELGQGNPTVATLNSIGEFFGLEVGFVPLRRGGPGADQTQRDGALTPAQSVHVDLSELKSIVYQAVEEALSAIKEQAVSHQSTALDSIIESLPPPQQTPDDGATGGTPARTKRKPRSSA